MTRFSPPPATPNCVSSRAPEADGGHYVAPLTGTTLAAAKAWCLSQPRTTLAEEAPGYLRVVFRSLVFRFPDDLELEEDGDVVHVRSASRYGYSDAGVNRKRVEALRRGVCP